MSARFDGEKRLTHSQIMNLAERQNYICYICGNRLYNCDGALGTMIDHVVPKAVHKWNLDLDDVGREELAVILNDDRNCLVAHAYCNKHKGSKLYTNDDINNVYLSSELKQSALEIIKKAKPFIDKYKDIYEIVLRKHEYKCCCCGRIATLRDSSIRRINNKLVRSIDNAVIIHNDCGKQFDRMKKRRSYL